MLRTGKFQGFCLVQEDGAGAKHMKYYDEMPKEVRIRTGQSKFNLCPACLAQEVDYRGDYTLGGYIKAIEYMERRILAAEKSIVVSQDDRKA